MNTTMTLPYEKITKKDWSINALLSALNTKREQGPALEKLASLNPVKLKKTEIQVDEIYRYIDISALSPEKGMVEEIKEMEGAKLPARATLQVQTGDLILSSVRPERNAVARITDNLSGCLVNNTFIVIRPHQRTFSYLLYFVLRTDNVRSKFMLIARGNAIPTMKTKDVKDVKLPIYGVTDEQEQTAEKLYNQWYQKQMSVQSLGDLVESVLRDFDVFSPVSQEQKHRTLYSAISYCELEGRWDVASSLNEVDLEKEARVPMRPLESLAVSFKAGATISAKEYQDEGTPYIRIKNIEKGTLTDHELVYVSEEWAEKFEKAIIKPYHVLISRVGTVGKTGVADKAFSGALASQHITLVEANREKLLPLFLSYFMMTEWGLTQLQQRASGSSQVFIKLKDIKELLVPAIPISDQEKIILAIKKKEFQQSDQEVKKEIEKLTNEIIV
ncbi:restriction endonuclease subunit S [Salisediminibacterium beveridgei]|uniref:Type I restriction-modification system, specificity subunit S n=1 Tax=Salisediminibacterium beveridgei TaxID=632773 RepID=A0A1D7QZN8_9BACI|nr:restriction endonuclease subunit S [Salisediminibacterium beveridgei]AOM84473.1 Type I restriction-modification system, specificity subunit S [Salisediminibacterium beveridgei]